MSQAGPESTAAERERAAELSDQAATRLRGARASLSNAVDRFTEADQALRRSEDDIVELRTQSLKVRDADPDELGWRLEQAADYAQGAERRLAEADDRFGELDAELADATDHLEAADKALDELERLPGGQTEQTVYMRRRLESFRDAVRVANENLSRSRDEFGTARDSIGPLLEVPEQRVDAEHAADQLRSVGSRLESGVEDLRRDLKAPLEELDTAASGAKPLEDEGAQLAASLRAAAVPPPGDRGVAPGSAEQSTLRQRLEGTAAERDHQRGDS
jgi:chromosome segregation ATPase